MKNKLIFNLLLQIFTLFSFTSLFAQNISAGYFNGHIFSTYPAVCGAYYNLSNPLSTGASLNGNNFSVTVGQTIAYNEAGCGAGTTNLGNTIYGQYTPGSMPTGNGWPTTGIRCFDAKYSVYNKGFTTFTFTSDLPYLTHCTVIDVDFEESIIIEFLNESDIPQPISGNIATVLLSASAARNGTISFPTSTKIKLDCFNSHNAEDPGYSFVMLTDNIRKIRFQQVTPPSGNPPPISGSYDFVFSIGTTDHGDAPSSYGDAQHYISNKLRLGALAPDAEATAAYSTNATGDNTSSGNNFINDEDGVSFLSISKSDSASQNMSNYTVSTIVTNSTGNTANLIAWIDWDNNGIFDASEGSVATTVQTGSINVTRTFNWTKAILLGAGGISGIFLRVRTTTDAITTKNASSSATTRPFAIDGEVEDFLIPLTNVQPR